MKRILVIVSMLTTLVSFSTAQRSDYKVVFDLTSKDTLNQQSLLHEMTLIKEGNPDAKVEAVIYGQGLGLITKDASSQSAEIQRLVSMKDVSIKVCALAMKRQNVDASQLLPGVQIVPDGIYEIIVKQRDGWGYIKVAR
ncbi:MAG TPA: DsrE family protein [Hanamia sp.]|nr:DsrE family protein [Hanamia sp.]